MEHTCVQVVGTSFVPPNEKAQLVGDWLIAPVDVRPVEAQVRMVEPHPVGWDSPGSTPRQALNIH